MSEYWISFADRGPTAAFATRAVENAVVTTRSCDTLAPERYMASGESRLRDKIFVRIEIRRGRGVG